MKLFARLALLGVVCLVVAVAAVSQLAGSGWWRGFMPLGQRTAPAHGDQNTDFETYPDPNAPETSKRVSLGGVPFDYDIFGVMLPYTGTIRDTNSLQELREAIGGGDGMPLQTFKLSTITSGSAPRQRLIRPSRP